MNKKSFENLLEEKKILWNDMVKYLEILSFVHQKCCSINAFCTKPYMMILKYNSI